MIGGLMQTAKVALYEIFGYILPGTVTLLSIQVVFCILNNGFLYIPESVHGSVLLIFVAYFLGHVNQAIGNLFYNIFQDPIIKGHESGIELAKKALNIDTSVPNEKALKVMLNIAATDTCKKNNIETFIEREGFYRGSTVGFIILFITMLVSLLLMDLQFNAKDYIVIIKKEQKIFLIILSGIVSVLFFKRYQRFLHYKIRAVLDAMR